ncbi:winged helix-turn-helix domain-containing protein [Ancylobacter sp. G4_0304]|uniref:winged helix-turn-helix domain-containing protein n=1 Tax=Ancylobacter sp. G4_0304 TaxID=3114289 RepID=UPI0039C69E3C
MLHDSASLERLDHSEPFRGLNVMMVTSDETLRCHVTTYLREHGCRVVGADRVPAVGRLQSERFNLLVLDAQLDPVDGFEALRRVRAVSELPIIMITRNRQDEIDCVVGLELGADDVLAAPLSPRELLARGRAILRRIGRSRFFDAENRPGGWRFIGWELRRRTRTLTDPSGRVVDLTRNEYTLLCTFLEAPRQVLSRVQLMRATRPHEDIFDRSIDGQVLRLRRKLQPNASAPQPIRTERGVGYLLDAEVEPLF